MVRSKDDLLEALKARIGESDDNETLEFLEDVTDTLSDYENKANGDGEDWKSKYEENDKAWRTKYKERFFNGGSKEQEEEQEEEQEVEKKTFADLFEVSKGDN